MEAPRVRPRADAGRRAGSSASTVPRARVGCGAWPLGARPRSGLATTRSSSPLPPPRALDALADHLASSGGADALAAALAHAATLAYEPVAAPCSLMNCGDVVHRR